MAATLMADADAVRSHLRVYTCLDRPDRRGGRLPDVGFLGEASKRVSSSSITTVSEHGDDVLPRVPRAPEGGAEPIRVLKTPGEGLDPGVRHAGEHEVVSGKVVEPAGVVQARQEAREGIPVFASEGGPRCVCGAAFAGCRFAVADSVEDDGQAGTPRWVVAAAMRGFGVGCPSAASSRRATMMPRMLSDGMIHSSGFARAM